MGTVVLKTSLVYKSGIVFRILYSYINTCL